MLNSVNMVGKIKDGLVIKETANGLQYGQFTIEVDRSYKKTDSSKDHDTFMVTVWRSLLESLQGVQTGSFISLQGRLADNNFVKDDGSVSYKVDIVADRIECLSR